MDKHAVALAKLNNAIKSFDQKNKERIVEAVEFATEKHKGQTRKAKDKPPYIIHPLAVATLLIECGVKDTDTIIVALLHDTIEDTKTTKEELVKKFGEKIAKAVLECSDNKK